MRTTHLLPLALFSAAVAIQACGSVKLEDKEPPEGRKYPVKGVIRGSVVYSGPEPCTRNGHIVGNAVLLVFDRRNPPPPSGLANTAVNFVAVAGDALFASQPRATGDAPCPAEKDRPIVTVSAPFAISPMEAGSYIIQAFFDYSGTFLPTFKFRNLPVQGDIGGGYIDVNDANAIVPRDWDPPESGPTPLVPKSSNPSYQPVFLNVEVGTPNDDAKASLRGVPTYSMPPEGFVADNVTVSIGAPLSLPRPYFYPKGSDQPGKPTATEPDGNYVPVATMTQDHQLVAQGTLSQDQIDQVQASFVQLDLLAGLPAAEVPTAIDPAGPFKLQLPANPKDAKLFVYRQGENAKIPEQILPALWPLVVLAKLQDDPGHVKDPQSLQAQGADLKAPVVILQAITLKGDSVADTALSVNSIPLTPLSPDAAQDHVHVLLRPTAICLDPRHIDRGGVLATPHFTGPKPDNGPPGPLFIPDQIASDPQIKVFLKDGVKSIVEACMPAGRYAINMVYPTGQAWTTPNEMGNCAPAEGALVVGGDGAYTCSKQPRPITYSQGARGVVEIVAPTTPAGITWCKEHPVPDTCLALPPE